MDTSNFCSALSAFRHQYGHSYVPPYPEFSALYKQCVYVRKHPDVAPPCLADLAFDWKADQHACRWFFNYYLLARFVDEHGHTRVPHLYPENKKLGYWVERQRRQPERLTAKQREMLDTINFMWRRARPQRWKQMYQELVSFYQEQGHTQVPSTHPNQNLAQWVVRQRRSSDQLNEKQRGLLRELGFQFDMSRQRDLSFEVYFNLLKLFQQEHGHTNVPASYPDKKLFNWVRYYRSSADTLDEERRRRLTSLGFEFSADKKANRQQAWMNQYKQVAAALESF